MNSHVNIFLLFACILKASLCQVDFVSSVILYGTSSKILRTPFGVEVNMFKYQGDLK